MDLSSTEVIKLTVAKSGVERLAEQIRQVAAVFERQVGIEEEQRTASFA